eukprot:1554997-Prymnesium_polylepis.1
MVSHVRTTAASRHSQRRERWWCSDGEDACPESWRKRSSSASVSSDGDPPTARRRAHSLACAARPTFRMSASTHSIARLDGKLSATHAPHCRV